MIFKILKKYVKKNFFLYFDFEDNLNANFHYHIPNQRVEIH